MLIVCTFLISELSLAALMMDIFVVGMRIQLPRLPSIEFARTICSSCFVGDHPLLHLLTESIALVYLIKIEFIIPCFWNRTKILPCAEVCLNMLANYISLLLQALFVVKIS